MFDKLQLVGTTATTKVGRTLNENVRAADLYKRLPDRCFWSKTAERLVTVLPGAYLKGWSI